MSPLSLCTSVHCGQSELLTGWGAGLNLQNLSPFQRGGEAHHRMGDQEGLVGILAHGTQRTFLYEHFLGSNPYLVGAGGLV